MSLSNDLKQVQRNAHIVTLESHLECYFQGAILSAFQKARQTLPEVIKRIMAETENNLPRNTADYYSFCDSIIKMTNDLGWTAVLAMQDEMPANEKKIKFRGMFDEIKRYGDNAVGAFVNALYVEALLDKKKTGWRQENESYSGLISGGEISREVEKLHGHPILLPNMSSLNVEARSQVEAFAKLFLTELVAEIKDVGPLSRALEVKGINLDSIQVDRVAKMLTEKSPAIDNR